MRSITAGAPARSGKEPEMAKVLFPMKAIRAKCLDCSGTSKAVKYCPCDGINSTRCELWPFRFGMRVPRATKLHGKELLAPDLMPDANTPLDELPT